MPRLLLPVMIAAGHLPRLGRAMLTVVAVLLAGVPKAALAFDQVSGASCQAAGTMAERRHGVPAGMLLAIGRVESGRRHPVTGDIVPWPWTINAAGSGRMFDNVDEAVATTRALRAQGTQSIDVGCFQVNLQHHPDAFPTLEHAFDPLVNADYAARFLVALRGRTGSWEEAVGAYHSATPELGGPYRDKVLTGWMQRGGTATALGSAPGLIPSSLVGSSTWNGAPGQFGIRIWTPSALGTASSVVSVTPVGFVMAVPGVKSEQKGAPHVFSPQLQTKTSASTLGWSGCAGSAMPVGSTSSRLKKC